ncbi:hypothetical protein VTI28DRAFT_2534 [Corynascus sepedonium]
MQQRRQRHETRFVSGAGLGPTDQGSIDVRKRATETTPPQQHASIIISAQLYLNLRIHALAVLTWEGH